MYGGVGNGGVARPFPTPERYVRVVAFMGPQGRYSPYQGVMRNKFVAPGSFYAPQQEGFLVTEITFRPYAQKLLDKRASPRIIILYVFAEIFVDRSKCRERGWVEIRCNPGESFDWDSDEDGDANFGDSMLVFRFGGYFCRGLGLKVCLG
jgi:hypothetical protein